MDELTVHTSDEVAVAERRREIGLLAASTVLSNPNYKPSDTYGAAVKRLASSFATYLETGA
jgi:hypothetical protein